MPEPAPTLSDLTGRTLGDYTLLRKLGSGGMGQVYLARQHSLKREVALKLLRDDLAGNDVALKRFQAEAEAVARINHPNIVQVYAVGEHDGLRFMVLEYVNGRNLRDYLSRKGPPELPIALTIMKQAAAALQRAGEQGIVHRDVKPENILLTKKAEVKVTDFGLSRLNDAAAIPLNLTQSGVTLGTPLYMAPEQVQGKATDHRSDLYSLGVTYYHLLAGEPPFRGATAYEVAMKHCTETAPSLATLRPDLPAGLIALVHRMMSKSAAERPASAKEVVRDIARIQKGQPVNTSTNEHSLLGSRFTPGAMMPVNGSTSVPGGPTISMAAQSMTAQSMALPTGSRWPARILGGLVIAGMAACGWLAFAALEPREDAPTFTGPGLPEVKVPDTALLKTQRERELVARLENRQTPAPDYVSAAIDLGLLYVRERQYDKARKVFDDLEKEKPDARGAFKGIAGLPPNMLAAKLGQGVVLAHQDKAEESVAAIQAVTQAAVKGPPFLSLQNFLMKHPALSQAVAEALVRDAENLKGKKLPQTVEWLRSPLSLIRGREKG